MGKQEKKGLAVLPVMDKAEAAALLTCDLVARCRAMKPTSEDRLYARHYYYASGESLV